MIKVIILITLAAIAKAVADTLTHHFETSIFTRYNRQFFDPSISWLNKYVGRDVTKGINKKVFQPLTDGWHMANSIMISCFIGLPFVVSGNMHGMIGYVIAGGLFDLVFNLFYNKLLRIKTKS